MCVGAARGRASVRGGSGSVRAGRVVVRGREQAFGEECVVRSARNAWRSLRVCVGAGRECRCAGASKGLRWGMCCEVGGRVSGLRGGAEVLGKGVSLCWGGSRSSARNGLWGRRACIAQPAGVRRGCVGERKCLGRARRCAGAGEGLRRGMCCGVGEECMAQPAGVRRRGEGVRKCSGRVRRRAGAGAGFRRGMGCEVGGFNALSPQPLARTRIIIYTSAEPPP